MGTARRAKPAAAAALIAAALALAACGGDDTEQGAGTDAAEDALSEAEVFRLALDDTCVNSAIGVNEVIAGEIPQRFSDSAEYEAGRAEIREQADVAAAIAPPAELEADYERYLQSLKDYATAYEQSAELAASGDRDGYDVAVQRRGELGDEQIAAAAGLDLTACARRLSPTEDAAVREITQRVLTGADPEASCDEDVTEQLKKNNVGRGDRCIESLGQLPADGASVDYLVSTGVDGVLASANVNLTTAAGQAPKYLVYDFIWDERGERWLMDSVFEPGTPAPSAEPPSGESPGA